MTHSSIRRLAILPLIVAVVLVALAGCTRGAGSSSGSAGGSSGIAAIAPQPAETAGTFRLPAQTADGVAMGATPQQGTAAAQQKDAALQQKDFVQTASIDLRTSDVDGADAKIAAGAARYGGTVQQDQRSGSDRKRTAVIVVRVAPEHLPAMMSLARGLGVEMDSTLQGEDVTAQHADVNARVVALRTSVARLEQLLSKSASLDALIKVEDQLSTRQAELDSTVAQQTALQNEIALSSLTVRLSAPPAVVTVRQHEGPSGFGRAVVVGWHGVLLAGRWSAASVGYALPTAAVAVLIALSAVWFARRFRNPRQAAVAVDQPGAGPDPTGQGR